MQIVVMKRNKTRVQPTIVNFDGSSALEQIKVFKLNNFAFLYTIYAPQKLVCDIDVFSFIEVSFQH